MKFENSKEKRKPPPAIVVNPTSTCDHSGSCVYPFIIHDGSEEPAQVSPPKHRFEFARSAAPCACGMTARPKNGNSQGRACQRTDRSRESKQACEPEVFSPPFPRDYSRAYFVPRT